MKTKIQKRSQEMNQKINENIVKKTKSLITIEAIIAASVIAGAALTMLLIKGVKVVRECR